MLYKIRAIIRNEFVALFHKPKIFLIAVSIAFMIDSVAEPMKKLSSELGYELNVIEPFLFITSKGLNIVIIPLVFVAVLSDFPSSVNTGYFTMIRNGRLSWYIGEVMFSLIISAAYILLLFCSIAIYCSGNGYIDNYWSDYTLKTYKDYPDVFKFGTMFLDTSVYTQGTPVYILIQTLILLILYLFILIQIMLMFRLIGKRSFGIMLTAGITFVGLPSYATTSKVRWVFPVTHIAYNWHFNEFFRKPYCTIRTSYIYLLALAAIFVIINLILVKSAKIGANYE